MKASEYRDKYLVVIPYLKKDAQGRELEFAVAGWRKHFKDSYLIVVVGDWHPVVDSGNDITFLECPRVSRPSTGNYWAHIDHVNKFRKVRAAFPYSTGFIYTCDDIYAVRDFTIRDVMRPKVRRREIGGSFSNNNAWVRDNYRTKKILMNRGLPVLNWVCHLPVWYDWDKLFAIYDKYDCDKKSRVVEQLYFNTYQSHLDYIVIEEEPNDYQFKLWDRTWTVDELKNAIGKKYWISNSVKGYRPEIDNVLSEYYGI